MRPTVPDRNREFDAQLPFLEVAAHQRLVGIVETRLSPGGVDQFLPHASPAVTPNDIKAWKKEIAVAFQFQLSQFDSPTLLAEFGTF